MSGVDPVTALKQQHGTVSRSTFDSDDEFMSIYNSLGSDYRSQLDPYMSYNYKNGWWDNFGNAIGFNTKEDSYRMQMQMMARQMAASLYNDQFQNKYNSASEQAARERAAGLNPDLTGTGDSDPAASMEQPPLPAPESLNPYDGLSQLAGIFSGVTSGIGNIATFCKTLADITNVKNLALGAEISNITEAANYLTNSWLPNQDPNLYPGDDLSKLREKFSNHIKNYSPGVQKIYNTAFEQFAGNPESIKRWRKSAADASKAGADLKIAHDFYGNFKLAEEAFAAHNDIYYSCEMRRLSLDAQYREMWSDYQLLKTNNDWDFEYYKQKYNLPQTLVESELATYIATKSKAELDKINSNYQIRWTHYLWKHRNDNTVMKWLANGKFSGLGYSPLFSNDIRTGFGTGASWSSPFGANREFHDNLKDLGKKVPGLDLTDIEDIYNID